MKRIYVFCYFACILTALPAQKGYDIKINFKGCKDTSVYLAHYFFDQLPVSDSCKNVKNGKIVFKGEAPLEKGVYFLANQSKSNFYFQFIVDDNQKFSVTLDNADITGTLKSDEKQNELFFSYVRYMTQRNRELSDFRGKLRGKPDSAKLAADKQETMRKEMTKFDSDFMVRSKG